MLLPPPPRPDIGLLISSTFERGDLFNVWQNLSGTTINEALYVILLSTRTSISYPKASVYCT